MGVFGFIDYSVIESRLKELSEDPRYISKTIERLVDEAIKEKHPKDYAAFIESHKGELKAIKEKLISDF